MRVGIWYDPDNATGEPDIIRGGGETVQEIHDQLVELGIREPDAEVENPDDEDRFYINFGEERYQPKSELLNRAWQDVQLQAQISERRARQGLGGSNPVRIQVLSMTYGGETLTFDEIVAEVTGGVKRRPYKITEYERQAQAWTARQALKQGLIRGPGRGRPFTPESRRMIQEFDEQERERRARNRGWGYEMRDQALGLFQAGRTRSQIVNMLATPYGEPGYIGGPSYSTVSRWLRLAQQGEGEDGDV